MAQKSVWLTWMPSGEGAPSPQPAVQALDRVGLAVTGAPWIDAPQDFAWTELGERLKADDGPDIWVVAGRTAEFANPDHRFGLAMVAALARTDRKEPFHLVLVGLDGMPDAESLPTLLRFGERIDGSGATWATKVLLATRGAPTLPDEPFRLRVSAQRMLGLWLEIGPVAGDWNGAMVGVSGDAKITNHAVGARGGLPERTVLEYKLEGLELDAAGDTFSAWAVQNRLDPELSYYVKVDGRPTRLLIGQHPDSDAEVSILSF